MTDVLVTTNDVTTVVVAEAPTTITTIVERTDVLTQGVQGPAGPQGSTGPQGPAGPSGESSLGGAPVSMSGLAPGDTILYSGAAWENKPKETISDGGNF